MKVTGLVTAATGPDSVLSATPIPELFILAAVPVSEGADVMPALSHCSQGTAGKRQGKHMTSVLSGTKNTTGLSQQHQWDQWSVSEWGCKGPWQMEM